MPESLFSRDETIHHLAIDRPQNERREFDPTIFLNEQNRLNLIAYLEELRPYIYNADCMRGYLQSAVDAKILFKDEVNVPELNNEEVASIVSDCHTWFYEDYDVAPYADIVMKMKLLGGGWLGRLEAALRVERIDYEKQFQQCVDMAMRRTRRQLDFSLMIASQLVFPGVIDEDYILDRLMAVTERVRDEIRELKSENDLSLLSGRRQWLTQMSYFFRLAFPTEWKQYFDASDWSEFRLGVEAAVSKISRDAHPRAVAGKLRYVSELMVLAADDIVITNNGLVLLNTNREDATTTLPPQRKY